MSLTSSPLNEIAISSLYAALSSKIGLTILTNDPQRARTLLYKIKSELNDPSLSNIAIKFSPTSPDNEIWLLKTSETSEAQDNETQAPEPDPETGIIL
jgi:hypothetical protein